MKAILIPAFVRDPCTLRPSTVPDPIPAPHEYLIRITHCSPQHADLLHAQGRHQNNHAKRGWCHPPFVLGFDFAGEVAALPSDSSPASRCGGGGEGGSGGGGDGPLRLGDRVFGAALGAFAELVAVPARAIRRVPDALSSATACAMSGQAVSYAAVVRVARVRSGETVLVSGASGGLGSVCCMVAKAVGARVIALTEDEGKAELMRRDMGVDLVLVMKGDWISEVMGFTGGRGVEVMLDNTGMVNEAIRCLAYWGRIVVLGFAARGGVMEEVKVNRLLLKSVTIIGYRFGETGRRFPQMLEQIWEGYLDMLRTGRLKALIYGSYDGLEHVGRALGDLAERKVYGKIVVKVADTVELSKL